MSFYINNKNIKNPFLKVLISLLAIVIVVLVGAIVISAVSSILLIVAVIVGFSLLIIPIALVFGLGKWMKGIRGSGNLLTEIREVKPFSKIKLSIACNFNIIASDRNEIEITSDDNLLGYILTYVQEDILYITSDNSLNPSKNTTLNMQLNHFDTLIISGSATGKIKDLHQDDMTIKISGNGNLTSNGKVDKLDIGISGVGRLSFKELVSKDAKIKISGTGKGDLTVTEKIDATINGTGKIDVYGNPNTVQKRVNGVGKVNIIK